MRYATLAETLGAAGLPVPSREQLQQLVGTAEGKAFADDLRWYAAGDLARHGSLAAVVHALDPGMLQTLARVGLRADLAQLIGLGKRHGAQLFQAIRSAANARGRAAALAYLESLGLERLPAVAPSAGPAAPPYYSFHIYASAAALCVSEARTRNGDRHTVQIEGALALGGGAPRTVDWANKIIVQLTPQECYQVLAVLENRIASARFDGHGARHDKSLSIERQDTHYFVRILQRGRPAVAVPVRPADALPFLSLLYKQIQLNEPHLAVTDIERMTQRMASMMAPS